MSRLLTDEIFAPVSGKSVQLKTVPDPTFSEKMMGDGMAIEPSNGKIVSPVDGEVIQLFPTKHAIGIQSENGVEILIHIGLETVALEGEGFEAHVSQGDQVKVGDPLITFDFNVVKEQAASLVTPVIITNGQLFSVTNSKAEETVTAGKDLLFSVVGEEESDSESKPTINQSSAYHQEAEQIVAAVGGVNNILAATHCVTRLRFALAEETKIDHDALEKIDLVKGSFETNGQFQVVIGQGTVDKVYEAMVHETGVEEKSKEDVKAASGKQQNVLQRGIKVLADIFIPILPAIVTAGLLMGLNNILANPGIFGAESVIEMYPQWEGIADMINIIASTAFMFLPALIGWSAVKRFGGNELLGVVLGLILVHPDLLDAGAYGDAVKEGDVPIWNILGLEIDKIGYQGQVLPVLLASWILAKIEIFLKKRVADSMQLLVVAPVALLLTGFVTFLVIGPVTFTLGNWITDGLVAIFDSFAVLGGLVYGAVYAPLVITGMHHTFLAVDLQLIGSTGATFLWPILALSNIAQGSAAFAMMLATKDEKLRGLSGTSGISAWLGITEPAMFGVNLRFRFPFIAAIIGSSIAGAYITMKKVLANSIGVGGVPGIFSIIPDGWLSFTLGMVIVMIIPFVLTFVMAKRKLK